jgi:hypothetical protein
MVVVWDQSPANIQGQESFLQNPGCAKDVWFRCIPL